MAIYTDKRQDAASDREEFAARVRTLTTFVGGAKCLSERTGLSRAVIGKYLGGKSEPSRDRLVKLAEAGGISIRWLATGEGDMRSDRQDYVRVPRHKHQTASSTGLQVSSEQIVDHLAFRADWVRQSLHVDPKSLVLIEACGDWMVPTIQRGDLILIETADPPFKQDGVYVIMRPEGLAAKRLVKRIDGSFEIRSDNPVYGFELARPDAFRILGRVLWFGRRL
jgi:phage repressor protein C with HTH and peptisase S24 domain